MKEISGERKNCSTNGIPCAMQEGGRCKYLRMDIVDVKKSPGPFLSLDQIKLLDFRTLIPMLSETDPMQKLNKEAIEREAKRPEVLDFGISPSYDKLPS